MAYKSLVGCLDAAYKVLGFFYMVFHKINNFFVGY